MVNMKTIKGIKFFIRQNIDKLNYKKDKFLNILYKLPFLQKPLPKNNSVSKSKIYSKKEYLLLHQKAITRKNLNVEKFEKELGYSIDKNWFHNVSLITQTSIKNSELNFNHGRIIYSLVCKYVNEKNDLLNQSITILETGSAKGFSSLCMSKAINDFNIKGKVITVDCISHNEKMYWNCIKDSEGKKTREELLKEWENELSNIIFVQGWTTETLKKMGINRINFAFLDAQHTKEAVLEEFNYVSERQQKGDMIFFDDVTPNIFDGVCNAVEEIEKNYPYKMDYLPFDKNRGYSLAIRI